MSVPQDVVRQLSVRLGGNALPREPMPGWRDIGCRATPKGRPNDDARTWHAAEIEARAGPGVAGSISNLSVGHFFASALDRCTTVQCRIMVCPMAVGRPMRRSKERKGCMCHWFLVQEGREAGR